MPVDMSPEAVTQRLKAMDELWILSVKLMQAGRPEGSSNGAAARGLEVYDSIRQVLLKEWDPIGIADEPGLETEYDAYIARVYRILAGTQSENDLIQCLRRIESDEMGIEPTDPKSLASVARKLLGLSVKLGQEPGRSQR